MKKVTVMKVFVRFGPPLDLYPMFAMKLSDASRVLKELGPTQWGQLEDYWTMANAAIQKSGVGNDLDERGGPYVLFPGYNGSDDFDRIPTPVFIFKQDNNGDTTVVSFNERLTYGDVSEEAEVTFITEQRIDVKYLKGNSYLKAHRHERIAVETH